MSAVISPKLEFDLNTKGGRLTGEVLINEAELSVAGQISAPKVSPDAVVIRNGETVGADAWPLHYDLRILLGDKVWFRGLGLETQLTGGLRVIGDEPGVATADGEVFLAKGSYSSHGRELEISRGRLLFSGGPATNPGLDLRAQRRIAVVTVGAEVSGTAVEPQVSLFSEPSMPEADILSYLIIGVPISDTSESQRGSLVGSATALGVLTNTDAVKELRDELGLEELRVEEAVETGAASLVVGRHLSSKLYLSYSLGITDAARTLRLNYNLGKHWELKTESGATATGTDLIYTIEK
jgi:translocation and assembly module TamB